MNAPDAFVFVGGRSARMGSDKALVELDGLTFLRRIVSSIRSVTSSITLIGRAGSLDEMPSIPDRREGFGPLAGIETALTVCNTERALVVACDLPFLSAAFLSLLVNRSDACPETAVVPLDVDGRVSPLCGVYPRSALALVTELLDRGERTPRALLVRITTDLVPFGDYQHLPGAADLLRNVNTPEDLSRAEHIAAGWPRA